MVIVHEFCLKIAVTDPPGVFMTERSLKLSKQRFYANSVAQASTGFH